MLLSLGSLASMTEKSPYRLQIFLSEQRRLELRQAAHEEYTSIQKLVERVLGEYLDNRQHRAQAPPATEAQG